MCVHALFGHAICQILIKLYHHKLTKRLQLKCFLQFFTVSVFFYSFFAVSTLTRGSLM